MERSLFLLMLVLGGIWLLMDEIKGKKRISAFVKGVLA